jgi:hypothetical protein
MRKGNRHEESVRDTFRRREERGERDRERE